MQTEINLNDDDGTLSLNIDAEDVAERVVFRELQKQGTTQVFYQDGYWIHRIELKKGEPPQSPKEYVMYVVKNKEKGNYIRNRHSFRPDDIRGARKYVNRSGAEKATKYYNKLWGNEAWEIKEIKMREE